MKTIKFRGQKTSTKEWVYGSLICDKEGNPYAICQQTHHPVANGALNGWVFGVIPETVGELTSFIDKNLNQIYEGDILSDWTETDEGMIQSKMQVFWCDRLGTWRLDNSYKQDKSSGDLLCDELADFNFEITGNIYDKYTVIKPKVRTCECGAELIKDVVGLEYCGNTLCNRKK